MSLLYVPIYKTEAGVHSLNPVIGTTNTLAVVAGKNVVKEAVEVLIKWNAGTLIWEEQSAYSAGVKTATKTIHPGTGETAYLYIPLNDYLAVAPCCGVGGTPQLGEGNGTAVGRVAWDAGTPYVGATPTPMVMNLANFVPAAPFAILISGSVIIGWPEGNYTYPEGSIVTRAFNAIDTPSIAIHYAANSKKVVFGDDAGGYRGTIQAFAGPMELTIEEFKVSNAIDALPVPLSPELVNVNLNKSALDVAEVNSLLDSLIAEGKYNGKVSVLTNPRVDPDIAKVNTLKERGWKVEAYGVYPNL